MRIIGFGASNSPFVILLLPNKPPRPRLRVAGAEKERGLKRKREREREREQKESKQKTEKAFSFCLRIPCSFFFTFLLLFSVFVSSLVEAPETLKGAAAAHLATDDKSVNTTRQSAPGTNHAELEHIRRPRITWRPANAGH